VNPVEAGVNFNGDLLAPCRAYHYGDIVPGKYNLRSGECHVAHNGGEHKYTGADVEVLCNPSNLNLQWVNAGSPPGNALRGGRTNERETLYNIRCALEIDGQSATVPGKYQPSTGAYISHGGQEYKCGSYEFVTCQ